MLQKRTQDVHSIEGGGVGDVEDTRMSNARGLAVTKEELCAVVDKRKCRDLRWRQKMARAWSLYRFVYFRDCLRSGLTVTMMPSPQCVEISKYVYC